MRRSNQFSPKSHIKATASLRRREEAQGSWFPRISSKTSLLFLVAGFVVFVFGIEIVLFNRLEDTKNENSQSRAGLRPMVTENAGGNDNSLPAHLLPKVPILPLFDSVSNADDYIASLLEGRPSMAGIIALLQKFISELHDKNAEVGETGAGGMTTIQNFYDLVGKYIQPFDKAYRGQLIFPVRSDDSIFMSIAAFREHLLTETLVSAFKHAKNPEKLFVGAVVQNCVGKVLEDGTIDTSGKPCFTGPQVVGQGKNGRDIKERLEAPVDRNGIEDFCALPDYEKYCKNGQIRVLYMHDTDSLGPSMARFYASKLWGGESYVVQIDSHVHFAAEWEAKYIKEIKLTKNYPKSVLSTYPPGFEQKRFIPKRMNIDLSKVNNETVIESPGCRLCNCATPPGESSPIMHIKQGKNYFGNETRPSQTAFIGAGFVFFRADFLIDIPFDPYLPWTFMGEEILLTMRAWTNGWNIYAPRRNLIIHQYRPSNMGIPKFAGAVNVNAQKGFGSNWLQKHTIRRIKNLAGYPDHTTEKIEADDEGYVLTDKDYYGLGSVRSWDDYMQFANLTVNYTTGFLDCHKNAWCDEGSRD